MVLSMVFFTRLGGISTGIYEGLNCGSGSKDDRDKIQFNLQLVAAEMNVNGEDPALRISSISVALPGPNSTNANRSGRFKSIQY